MPLTDSQRATLIRQHNLTPEQVREFDLAGQAYEAMRQAGFAGSFQEAVPTIMEARRQAHAQHAAVTELATFVQAVGQEGVQQVEAILHAYGPAELGNVLSRGGMSSPTVAHLLGAISSGQLEQLDQEVAGAVRYQQVEAEVARAVEAWGVPEGADHVTSQVAGTPIAAAFRDPGWQRWAALTLPKLEAAGFVQRAPGQSPLEAVLGLVRAVGGIGGARHPFQKGLTPEKAMEHIAQVLGEPVSKVKEFIGTVERADVQGQLTARLAGRDPAALTRPAPTTEAAPANAKPSPASLRSTIAGAVKQPHGTNNVPLRTVNVPNPAPAAAKLAASSVAPDGGLRATVEAAVRQHGGTKPQKVAVGNSLQATIALAAGHKTKDIQTIGGADKLIREQAELNLPSSAPAPSLRDTIASALEAEEESASGSDE